MSIIINGMRNRSYYVAGFSGTVTVPDSITSLKAWVQGAGGAGRETGGYDSGGGGGAFCLFETDILETEWGTSVSLTVGSAVDDADGEDSTFSGTLNGAAFSVSAGGGSKTAGIGGTASGGTTNVDGYAGESAVPADMTDGSPGLPGGDGIEWVEIGGMGGLGLSTDLPAQDGYIALEWG